MSTEPAAKKAKLSHHKKIWYAPNKFEAYGEEEIKAVEAALRDGWLAPGPRTAKFEERVAKMFGKKHGIFVNSGSSALILAYCVAGLQPGDEVVTPALTFSTTVAPIVQLGGKPVFCDAEYNRYVPSVDAIMEVVTEKTKIISIPNLVGSKPDWKELRRRVNELGRNIVLVEDSADTMTYTPDSDISTCSFYASHIITCGGGGGIMMCNTEEMLKKAYMFRDWGRIGNNSEDMSERFGFSVDGIEYDFKFLYGVLGYNLKSTEMNCAFGLVQLDKFDEFYAKRRANITRYMERLKGSDFVLPDESREEYNWLAMPFTYKHRKLLLNYLEEHGIQTRVMFAGNITRHPAYRQYLADYPEADRVMKDGFLLGAHHGLELEDIDYVCDVMLSFKPPENAAELEANDDKIDANKA